MHVLANIGYEINTNQISTFLLYDVVAAMGVFVQLFFMISGFGMCCGYYEKIRNNEISFNVFYYKRYRKVLPFFALLVFMDLGANIFTTKILEISNLYEAYVNLTLLTGFLTAPNITVIGVGWALGVIFGFYILFPFFVFLIWNKKRAWCSFVAMVLIHWLSNFYFVSNGEPIENNVARWFCYFIAGGLIYLYRLDIEKLIGNNVIFTKLLVSTGAICVFVLPNFVSIVFKAEILYTFQIILGFSMMLIGAIGKDWNCLSNVFSKFISSISLEIYLSHMFVFCVIEKIGLLSLFGETLASYLITCVLVIAGAIIFSVTYQWIIKQMGYLYLCYSQKVGIRKG